MANNTAHNPWILDTAGVATANPVSVSQFQWQPVAQNDDLEVTHADGITIWKVRATAAGSNDEGYALESIVFSHPVSCSGLTVKTIDSGKLYVYLNSLF
jgi:hypothetical protein